VKGVIADAVETTPLGLLRRGLPSVGDVWLDAWDVEEIRAVEGYEIMAGELIATVEDAFLLSSGSLLVMPISSRRSKKNTK
jgi:hypothetical protein